MLIQAKSNLAKLLATENITVEQRNVSTASFSVKDRVLIVPALNENISDELYDLFIGHEVGHALETPLEGLVKTEEMEINRHILNIVEDVRIEKKIKRKFPGLKYSFYMGYKDLMERDFFEIKGRDLNDMNFLDRMNLHTKAGKSLSIAFTQEEYVLVEKTFETETFEDVIELSKEIQKFINETQSRKKTKIKKGTPADDPSGESGTKGSMQKDENDDEKGTGYNSKGEPADDDVTDIQKGGEKAETTPPEASKGTEENDADVGDADNGQIGAGGYNNTENVEIKSETMEALNENLRNIFETDKKWEETHYLNVPKVNLENIIVPYKKLYSELRKAYASSVLYNVGADKELREQAYNKFRKETTNVVNYLAKEFELRKNARQIAKTSIAKTGVLNEDALFAYKFSEDLFKRSAITPNGQSHGLVMFLDWSGSMLRYIRDTIRQTINLAMFCRKVHIPFEVYAFTDRPSELHDKNNKIEIKINDLVLHHFSLLNVLSSRMNNNEFNASCNILLNAFNDYGAISGTPTWFHLGSTPLNEAIISSFEIAENFKKENRLDVVNLVFLTDGEANRIVAKYVPDIKGALTHKSYNSFNSSSKTFLRDPVTQATVLFSNNKSPRTEPAHKILPSMTTALIALLKQRISCNIVGFYICKGKNLETAISCLSNKWLPYNELKAYREIFDKEDSFIYTVPKPAAKHKRVVSKFYDEFYILKTNSITLDDEEEFQVKSLTTRSLVNAFSKYNSNKIQHRVILSRFIGTISE